MTVDRRIEIGVILQEAESLWECHKKVGERDQDRMITLTFALAIQNTWMLLELLQEVKRINSDQLPPAKAEE
jgi:hypothetical protein